MTHFRSFLEDSIDRPLFFFSFQVFLQSYSLQFSLDEFVFMVH
jgi:hypothetical protein